MQDKMESTWFFTYWEASNEVHGRMAGGLFLAVLIFFQDFSKFFSRFFVKEGSFFGLFLDFFVKEGSFCMNFVKEGSFCKKRQPATSFPLFSCFFVACKNIELFQTPMCIWALRF
jgi:hypothetical protein